MRILSLNCGSSSVKSALIDADSGRRLQELRVEDVDSDLPAAVQRLLDDHGRAWADSGPPDAVAHRIVHGGDQFVNATRLDDSVLAAIEQLSSLAPLHNPPALAAVRQARKALPDVPHVAVFDTAFHATLPAHAREYALPAGVRQRFGIRRFGFHGINHRHVAGSVAAWLKVEVDTLRIISCHLGNGASVTAIDRGRSVDTSMGMTPLEGLVMGSRAGDVDPGVLLLLQRSGQFDADQLDELLNKRSGLQGIAGENDMREITKRAARGDQDCELAIAMYVHRVRKYIGAYLMTMGGADVIAFTGGVGEHSSLIRQRCSERLQFAGAMLDDARNRDAKLSESQPVAALSTDDSQIRVLAVRADEELEMAREAAAILKSAPSGG